MTTKQDWTEAIDAAMREEKRIKAYFLSVFPDMEYKGAGNKGQKFSCVFNRRTWTIEYFEDCDQWKCGIYIAEQVKRHPYFWEIASGNTPEEAIDRLKLRIKALQDELKQVGGLD